jgi:hypothetical protein
MIGMAELPRPAQLSSVPRGRTSNLDRLYGMKGGRSNGCQNFFAGASYKVLHYVSRNLRSALSAAVSAVMSAGDRIFEPDCRILHGRATHRLLSPLDTTEEPLNATDSSFVHEWL